MTEQNWKEKYRIGSMWETRNGDKAIVVDHKTRDGLAGITVCVNLDIYSLNINGCETSSIGSDFDLMRTWKEKKTGTMFLNVYEGNSYEFFMCKKNADHRAQDIVNIGGSTRIAFKEIQWTEGEGL